MKRIGFFVLCLLASATMAFAQGKAEITVDKADHDFGTVAEEAGNISCDFIIKNTGNAPLVISNVTSSCGCTTPNWTKAPIAPGATGTVTATYGAKGRPGPFSKSISVYTNVSTTPKRLTIKGNVTPVAQSPEAAYPVAMGDLRLKKSLINFGAIKETETRTTIIDAYNNGKTPLQVSFKSESKHINVTCSPTKIEAGKTGIITITYNAKNVGKYGSFEDIVEITTTPTQTGKHTININSSVTQDFSKMTDAEKANAPVIKIEPASLNFNALPKTKTLELTISNTGKSNLIIHNIQSTQPSILTISSEKKEIKPGKIQKFKVSVNPDKVKNNTSVYININTNDPKLPMKSVRAVVSVPK